MTRISEDKSAWQGAFGKAGCAAAPSDNVPGRGVLRAHSDAILTAEAIPCW
jgi:hypothetical protein